MPGGLLARVLVVASLAAGLVGLATIATFKPVDTAVDDRPFCSGFALIPYVRNGLEVRPTFSPGCHGGPYPADALAPSPTPAVLAFLLVGSLGVLVVGFTSSPGRGPAGRDGG